MTTATLPRTAGNGAALVVVAANFVLDLLEKAMHAPAAKAASATVNVASKDPAAIDIWQLYRLGAGGDSVSPKAIAKLQQMAATN